MPKVSLAQEPDSESKISFKLENIIISENQNITKNIDIEVGQSLAEKRSEEAKAQAQASQIAQANLKLALARPIKPRKPGTSGRPEVDQLIDSYVNQYGINQKADQIKRIVYCESRGDPNAKNRRSSAGGLAQYLDRTWANTPEGVSGQSKYDPNAAISALTRDISQGHESKWNASARCWR